jgi:hypothetical protein
LPPMAAMGIAMRLKSGSAAGPGQVPAAGGNGPQGMAMRRSSEESSSPRVSPNDAGKGDARGGPGRNWRAGAGPPDFQQMLNRMPAVSITDLNKGDAVMLVATQGSAASGPTAITLLAGVEPILSASPTGASTSTILSPWNLGAPSGVQDTSAQ